MQEKHTMPEFFIEFIGEIIEIIIDPFLDKWGNKVISKFCIGYEIIKIRIRNIINLAKRFIRNDNNNLKNVLESTFYFNLLEV